MSASIAIPLIVFMISVCIFMIVLYRYQVAETEMNHAVFNNLFKTIDVLNSEIIMIKEEINNQLVMINNQLQLDKKDKL